MNMGQATQLVTMKYQQESSGLPNSTLTAQYDKACEEFPAVMKLAHIYFALQFDKTS